MSLCHCILELFVASPRLESAFLLCRAQVAMQLVTATRHHIPRRGSIVCRRSRRAIPPTSGHSVILVSTVVRKSRIEEDSSPRSAADRVDLACRGQSVVGEISIFVLPQQTKLAAQPQYHSETLSSLTTPPLVSAITSGETTMNHASALSRDGSEGARSAETASFDLKVGSVPTIVQWDVPLASIRASLRLPLCFQIRHRMLRNGGGGPRVVV